jgi:hypothetical protein
VADSFLLLWVFHLRQALFTEQERFEADYLWQLQPANRSDRDIHHCQRAVIHSFG